MDRPRRCWICCQWPIGWLWPDWVVRWHLERVKRSWHAPPRMGYADLVRLWTSYRGDKYLAHMAAAIDRAEHGE